MMNTASTVPALPIESITPTQRILAHLHAGQFDQAWQAAQVEARAFMVGCGMDPTRLDSEDVESNAEAFYVAARNMWITGDED